MGRPVKARAGGNTPSNLLWDAGVPVVSERYFVEWIGLFAICGAKKNALTGAFFWVIDVIATVTVLSEGAGWPEPASQCPPAG